MMYKWKTGMWAWVLHRLSGLGLIFFLMMHIYEMSQMSKGEEGFKAAMKLMQNPVIQFMELGLYGIILYHSLNGIRILFVDFWGGARYHKQLFSALMLVGVVVFLAGAYMMVGHWRHA